MPLLVLVAIWLVIGATASEIGDPTCSASSFAADLKDWQCLGLEGWAKGQGPRSAKACMQECCDRGPAACGIWQWGNGPVGTQQEQGGCWLGDQHIGCKPYKGWIGGGNLPSAACPGKTGKWKYTGVDFDNSNLYDPIPAATRTECCANCRKARCQAWVFNPANDGAECTLKKWSKQAKPIKSSTKTSSYGFGPGTDCVTEASHVCNSVPTCQAFGIGAIDSNSFSIELYSCLDALGPGKSWAVYRKQDKYSAPFEQRRGDQSACTSFIKPQTSFVCEQVPYAEGRNVALNQCDSSLPAQKWKLEAISKSLENGGLEAQPTRFHNVKLETKQIDPALCKIPGVWANGNSVYEIRGSNYGATNRLSMLALNPTDWLTASATYKILPGSHGSIATIFEITAVFDNGKTLVGRLDRTVCTSIDWGPPAEDSKYRRYAWGSPCNDTDSTQRGWTIQQYSDSQQGGQYAILKYHQTFTDPQDGALVVFDGCLDRAGTSSAKVDLLGVYKCTNLEEQRWRMLPVGNKNEFALQSYLDPNKCVGEWGLLA
jgi:hypothetical protein